MLKICLTGVALVSLLISCSHSFAEECVGYDFLTLDCADLFYQKMKFREGEPGINVQIKKYIDKAEKCLMATFATVVDKEILPPSGDKHDYISIGPYWWPNPETENGLPYIRRDGYVNVESQEKYKDREVASDMFRAIESLGYAYYFTNNLKYAECANRLLYDFFVNQDTKMNPNLNYGQFVPGIAEGRSEGIIEMAAMVNLLEGIALMRGSGVLSDCTNDGVRKWMTEFSQWLINSDLGNLERGHKNNHATYFDRLYVGILLYLDCVSEAKKYFYTYVLKHLEEQVDEDGSQPNELCRARSWHYSVENLYGFIDLALIGEKIGINLWNYSCDGRKPLKDMIDWFLPYIEKKKIWIWRQVIPEKVFKIKRALELASQRYNSQIYIHAKENLQSIHSNIIE